MKNKNIIFIGKGDVYDRIAKPIGKEEISFTEAKKIIGCSIADISQFYYAQEKGKLSSLPFQIIVDDEGMLVNKPPVIHNGSQYLHGNIIIGKYNESKNLYEGLDSNEISTLYKFIKNDFRNDINLNPLKSLMSQNTKLKALKKQVKEKSLNSSSKISQKSQKIKYG